MRNTGGELTDRGELLGVDELRLRILQLGVRRLELAPRGDPPPSSSARMLMPTAIASIVEPLRDGRARREILLRERDQHFDDVVESFPAVSHPSARATNGSPSIRRRRAPSESGASRSEGRTSEDAAHGRADDQRNRRRRFRRIDAREVVARFAGLPSHPARIDKDQRSGPARKLVDRRDVFLRVVERHLAALLHHGMNEPARIAAERACTRVRFARHRITIAETDGYNQGVLQAHKCCDQL